MAEAWPGNCPPGVARGGWRVGCGLATLRAAASSRFPRDRLTFEILESESIADTAHLAAIIAEYRKHGFRIALDDFGTGYSGLSRLAELRPDIIKVDRVLVQDCDKDRVRLAIIASLLSLGAEIGVKVVVEGVEHASEVAALRSVGARFLQGFPLRQAAVRRHRARQRHRVVDSTAA